MKKLISSSLLIFLIFCSCNLNKGNKNIENAYLLHNGMSMSEVVSQMGKPDDSLKGYADEYKIMFLYQGPIISSDDIYIYFDADNKKVTNIVLPKGY